jgi:hypothetical protein
VFSCELVVRGTILLCVCAWRRFLVSGWLVVGIYFCGVGRCIDGKKAQIVWLCQGRVVGLWLRRFCGGGGRAVFVEEVC